VRALRAHYVATRELADLTGRARGAALNALRAATRGAGRAALYAAVDAGVDALTVAVVAWELCGVCAQPHPALTPKRRLHLERYCRIAAQLLGPGAGERYLLDLIHGHQAATGGEVVHSLDHFVCQLRRWLKATRRALKGKPPIPHNRSGWFEERLEREERAAAAAKLKGKGRPRRARR
jgi:hypothetical protein